ncbi:tautomerase family protein [Pseudodonghicola flavimaris]|uniref:Tautomerase family protein n=1 Tax=Pseudodonghicola flavimaris TaxID=3050036 RepID=A0ABT7F2F9_9RHOB|nr:tautomerase family protein [Pseudodonghicola flavimaris]MDK3018790.1 tautomerase family protein [Pseudodonghicola flavimaris]
MPHVIVKAWPGKTEDQKKRLAEAISRNVMEIFEYGADAVSVAIEEVAPARWKEDVYQPDIAEADPQTLYKTPGYEM